MNPKLVVPDPFFRFKQRPTRSVLLQAFESYLQALRDNDERELIELRGRSDLSKNMIQINVEREQKLTALLKSRLDNVKRASSSGETLGVFVYQSSFMTPPTESEVLQLGFSNDKWYDVPGMTYMTGYQRLGEGEMTSSFHPRAETEHYFKLIYRF